MDKKFKSRKYAFKKKTRKGDFVYRITLNNAEILDNLENNKQLMCIDIPANLNVTKATNKNGKAWEGIEYYTWAIVKSEDKPAEVKAEVK